jgi:hypothetical protein
MATTPYVPCVGSSEDRQRLVPRPPAAEGVGRVGETVFVEGAGEEDPGSDRQGRGDDGGDGEQGDPVDGRDDEPEESPDDREPEDRATGVEASLRAGRGARVDATADAAARPGPDREAGQKGGGIPEAPHRSSPHSANVATSVTQAAASLTSGSAANAPLASPRRRPRSRRGVLPSLARRSRWPGSPEQWPARQ